MTKKQLKFAYYRFHWVWKYIIMLCLLSIISIGVFAEFVEIVRFGYEIGLILMPLASSIFVSLLLFFFTSHLQQSIDVMNTINRFDDFRHSIVKILRFCHEKSGSPIESPTFNETNLFDLYKIELSQDAIEKKITIERYKEDFLIANWLGILIGTVVRYEKSNSFNGINDGY